jgi:acetyl-CoA carboxylase carboxyl transferase subunit alpha
VPEPAGGAHSDWEGTGAALREALARNLDELRALPTEELRRLRLEKYMGMGEWRNAG